MDAGVLFGLHSLSDAALVAGSPSSGSAGSEESTQSALDLEKETTKMLDLVERANDIRHRIEVLEAEEKSLREEASKIEKVLGKSKQQKTTHTDSSSIVEIKQQEL